MAGSVHSDGYGALLAALVKRRQAAGLSQAALAARLGKPASFVGKYELGERRLDVIELAVILREMGTSVELFWEEAGIKLPERL